jgi:RimJ/RimL family protein N-acetyltransferase
LKCVHDVPGRPIKTFIEAHIPSCAVRGLPEIGHAIGVVNDKNELIGGFYYHDWNADAGVIEISGASIEKRWLTRSVLYGLFSYPFDHLKCQLVAMRHSANDKALCRMLRSYGFDQVYVSRLFGRDHDAIISTLTDDSWRANGYHKENE